MRAFAEFDARCSTAGSAEVGAIVLVHRQAWRVPALLPVRAATAPEVTLRMNEFAVGLIRSLFPPAPQSRHPEPMASR